MSVQTSDPPSRKRGQASSLNRRETLAALGFISAWVFGFLDFTAWLMVASLDDPGLPDLERDRADQHALPAVGRRHIALPLVRTPLIVVFIFELKASWTDLIKPLIYLQDTALYTLPRGLKAILDRFGQGGDMQWEIVPAASVIVTLPMIVIFFIGQRYFMDGIATTGRKG